MNKQMDSGQGGWGVALVPGGDQRSPEQPCCPPRGETEAGSPSEPLCPGQGVPLSQGPQVRPRSTWQRTAWGRAETWARCHVKFLPAAVEAEGEIVFFFFPQQNQRERERKRKRKRQRQRQIQRQRQTERQREEEREKRETTVGRKKVLSQA